LLSIESSPTTCRGIERLLVEEAFEVVSVRPTESFRAVLDDGRFVHGWREFARSPAASRLCGSTAIRAPHRT
jgi:hypothetical protein